MLKTIAIEGILGVGKTQLVQQLSQKPGYVPFYEPVKENEYLGRFYENPSKWAFPMQMELLFRRYLIEQQAIAKRALALTSGNINSVFLLDRSLMGDFVFALVNHELDNISVLEWETYLRYYHHFKHQLKLYDLIIYLEADPKIAQERLEGRDRWQEQNIPLSYYKKLDHVYRRVLESYEEAFYVDWNEPNQDIQIIENIIAKEVYK